MSSRAAFFFHPLFFFTWTLEERIVAATHSLSHTYTVIWKLQLCAGDTRSKHFKILPLIVSWVRRTSWRKTSVEFHIRTVRFPSGRGDQRLTFDEPGRGCYVQSGHVAIIFRFSVTASVGRYRWPGYQEIPFWNIVMCYVQRDQFAFSGWGFKTGQGVSRDSMSVMMGMKARQLYSPSPPQVWPRPWTPPGALWTGECAEAKQRRRNRTVVLIWGNLTHFGLWMEMLNKALVDVFHSLWRDWGFSQNRIQDLAKTGSLYSDILVEYFGFYDWKHLHVILYCFVLYSSSGGSRIQIISLKEFVNILGNTLIYFLSER